MVDTVENCCSPSMRSMSLRNIWLARKERVHRMSKKTPSTLRVILDLSERGKAAVEDIRCLYSSGQAIEISLTGDAYRFNDNIDVQGVMTTGLRQKGRTDVQSLRPALAVERISC